MKMINKCSSKPSKAIIETTGVSCGQARNMAIFKIIYVCSRVHTSSASLEAMRISTSEVSNTAKSEAFLQAISVHRNNAILETFGLLSSKIFI